MTVVRCPRCRDEVTVPAKVSGKALVRCPLCLEEYLLAEALAQAPPLLVVIGGDPDGGMLPDDGATAAAASDEGYQLAGGGFTAELLDTSAPATTTMPPRPMLRGGRRPRKKELNVVVEAVKVVLGGVIGLSLGLLILWWVLGVDVDLGPPIARYFPAIVPPKFRGQPQVNATAPADRSPATKLPATPRKFTESQRIETTSPTEAASVIQDSPLESSTMIRAKGNLPDAAASDVGALQTLPPVRAPSPASGPLDVGGLTIDDPLAAVKPPVKPQSPQPAASSTPVAPVPPAAPPPPMPDLSDLLPE